MRKVGYELVWEGTASAVPVDGSAGERAETRFWVAQRFQRCEEFFLFLCRL
jgi:hypothetical protein